MAIYHLSIRNVSGTKNQSAASRVAYVLRLGKYASKRDDLQAWGSLNLPKWATNGMEFFSAADSYEARGQRAKTMDIALPIELSPTARRVALEKYLDVALATSDGRKMPAVWAIHDASDGKNPHAHVIFSRRADDGIERTRAQYFKRANKSAPKKGGASKDTATDGQKRTHELREAWEAACNVALTAAGLEARIDARTLRDQGIDRTPGRHRGPFATAEIRTSRELSELQVQEAAAELALVPPQEPIHIMDEDAADRRHAEGMDALIAACAETAEGEDYAEDLEDDEDRPGLYYR
jgi:hypothetical protein